MRLVGHKSLRSFLLRLPPSAQLTGGRQCSLHAPDSELPSGRTRFPLCMEGAPHTPNRSHHRRRPHLIGLSPREREAAPLCLDQAMRPLQLCHASQSCVWWGSPLFRGMCLRGRGPGAGASERRSTILFSMERRGDLLGPPSSGARNRQQSGAARVHRHRLLLPVRWVEPPAIQAPRLQRRGGFISRRWVLSGRQPPYPLSPIGTTAISPNAKPLSRSEPV